MKKKIDMTKLIDKAVSTVMLEDWKKYKVGGRITALNKRVKDRGLKIGYYECFLSGWIACYVRKLSERGR